MRTKQRQINDWVFDNNLPSFVRTLLKISSLCKHNENEYVYITYSTIWNKNRNHLWRPTIPICRTEQLRTECICKTKHNFEHGRYVHRAKLKFEFYLRSEEISVTPPWWSDRALWGPWPFGGRNPPESPRFRRLRLLRRLLFQVGLGPYDCCWVRTFRRELKVDDLPSSKRFLWLHFHLFRWVTEKNA